MMKRKLLVLLLVYSVLVFLPIEVFAGNATLDTMGMIAQTGGYSERIDQYSMSKFIGSVISSFLSLLGIIFVVLMIYGGFKWMKASGREDEVKKAQDVIKQAIIGLIITASSYAIYQFVMSGLLG